MNGMAIGPEAVPSRSGRRRPSLMRAARRRLSSLVWPDLTTVDGPRVVVMHEWLAVTGGSDKVAGRLARLVDADVVVTFALDDDCVAEVGFDCPVITWRFGRWAARSRRFTYLLPVMPFVWWSLELSSAETVITSSHSCVNAARRTSARRWSYCHTPMRYAWEWRLERERAPRLLRSALGPVAAVLRRLDRRWARNVDTFVANSSTVAQRIADAYGRSAEVVPPPISVRSFPFVPARRTDDQPFVAAGRLVPYKRFDLAIAAANLAGVPLVVAGDGPDLARLQAMAGPTVSIVRGPDDATLAELLADARGFVFPGVEDFGMLAVEAQACGTPVIARRAGGALDSVRDGVTGVLVDGDSVIEWSRALSQFPEGDFEPARIRSWAEGFDAGVFDRRIRAVLDGETVDGKIVVP